MPTAGSTSDGSPWALAYESECHHLRACGELLRLPPLAIATGLVFLHRFRSACPQPDGIVGSPHWGTNKQRELRSQHGWARLGVDPESVALQRLVGACLFLASKTEEAVLRASDLLMTVQAISTPNRGVADRDAAFPSLAAPSPAALGGWGGAQTPPAAVSAAAGPMAVCSDTKAKTRWNAQAAADARSPPPLVEGGGSAPVGEASARDEPLPVVGDAYYAAKERLIWDEAAVLRYLRFQICLDHPFRYLLNFCSTLGCSPCLAQLGVSLVNDSLLRTSLCVDTPPELVAAGALHLAALLQGAPESLPSRGSLHSWDALGLDLLAVEVVSHRLMNGLRC